MTDERLALAAILRKDRAKPKWEILSTGQEVMNAALKDNSALFENHTGAHGGWLHSAVFAKGGFNKFMDKLKPGEIHGLWALNFDFTESVMSGLCDALYLHRPTALRFIECGVDDECVKLLTFPSSLIIFDAVDCRISRESLVAITQEIVDCSTDKKRVKLFSRLCLCGVGMKDNCFVELCGMLPKIKGLMYLDMSENELTDRSLAAFAKVVNRCETLVEVDFSTNKIASLASLCAPLRENMVLQKLHFQNNAAIEEESARALFDAIPSHSLIWFIDFEWTNVPEETQKSIDEELERRHTQPKKALVTMLSVRGTPSRVMPRSALRNLPHTHLRLVKEMLE